jgi:hypothetical protein
VRANALRLEGPCFRVRLRKSAGVFIDNERIIAIFRQPTIGSFLMARWISDLFPGNSPGQRKRGPKKTHGPLQSKVRANALSLERPCFIDRLREPTGVFINNERIIANFRGSTIGSFLIVRGIFMRVNYIVEPGASGDGLARRARSPSAATIT